MGATISLGRLKFSSSCEIIDAKDCRVSDEEALSLGRMLSAGKFGTLKKLHLVSRFLLCSVHLVAQLLFEELLAMTLDLQTGNQIGDAGACGLGQGLMANSSLQRLNLVSRFSH